MVNLTYLYIIPIVLGLGAIALGINAIIVAKRWKMVKIKLCLANSKLREAIRLENRAEEFLQRAIKLRYDAHKLKAD